MKAVFYDDDNKEEPLKVELVWEGENLELSENEAVFLYKIMLVFQDNEQVVNSVVKQVEDRYDEETAKDLRSNLLKATEYLRMFKGLSGDQPAVNPLRIVK
jgi:hypothetical protein